MLGAGRHSRMNRSFQVAVVATSTCVVGLLLFGALHSSGATPAEGPYPHLGVYSEVLSHIQTDYVEEPDMKSVTMGAINGMLEALDPFASYLNADQYKQYLATKQNPKASVGLYLSKRLGYMMVVDSLPGSPAAKAGLTTGDILETINNISTHDMPLAFAEIILQGDAGTTVKMSVLRTVRSDPQEMTLTRAMIVNPPMAAHMETADQVGVISSPSLDDARVREISQRIGELEKQGAKTLILDLRHCTTGDPQVGVALANLFMDKGLIAYTQGQKSSKQEFQASASKQVTKLPLVVLTDRGTAGAAEVAAAALLESKRAQVVGERTFGDAAVRKDVKLDDGSAVILSVAKYYGPNGKPIQDNGPDFGVIPSVLQAETEALPEVDENAPDAQDAPAPPKAGPDLILQKALETIHKG
jgi:carboxyl-terminal processing protease